MEITVSQALDWWKCPQYHWYYHVLKRAIEGEYKGPADLGTLSHAGLEGFMGSLIKNKMQIPSMQLEMYGSTKYWDLKAKLIKEYEEKGGELKPKEPAAAEALTMRLAWWVREGGDWQQWDQVLAAEKVFKVELAPGIILRGRADAYVIYRGKVWHVQWKTHSGGLAQLEILIESSMHEATFKLGAEVLYPDYEYGGTMLGAFDKEPLHIPAKGQTCSCCGRKGYRPKPIRPFCNIRFLDIHDGFVKDAKTALVEAAQGIRDQFNYMDSIMVMPPTPGIALTSQPVDWVHWPKNLNSCADIFKKTLCQYRAGACQRRTSIMDQFAYKDIEPQAHYGIKV